MNPPFASPPLLASLSTISAESDYQNISVAYSISSNPTAKGALSSISQSQKPQTDITSDGNSFQPSSCRSPTTTNGTSPKSANLKASQWSTLVSVGQNDIITKKAGPSVNSEQSQLDTASSYTITPQALLLSAQSVESLPHHARRKLSLSEPRDSPNSAPNMHRRPVTGYNHTGIFCDPDCRLVDSEILLLLLRRKDDEGGKKAAHKVRDTIKMLLRIKHLHVEKQPCLHLTIPKKKTRLLASFPWP